jgi:hypothetical protein
MLPILREIRAEMATKVDIARLDARLGDTDGKIADLRSEMNSRSADVASDMMDIEKRLSDRIALLNRAAMEYHSSTIGHGVLYSDIEDRVRRIERRLKFDV